ncbi:glutamic acid-rich protein-like [Chenopodium quinoa]|uniref:glutamic acid-rich protein-like n=1 Tax=Chenopodium quinoa TaxID=63459 RepID=UPI000B796428|nr:glutamic acid-rich protein-like [Chenopodium quinoa]
MSGSGKHSDMGKADEADPFTPLSSAQEREAYYWHKFLVGVEKILHPNNPNILEDVEIVDTEPLSIRYHLWSISEFLDQYDTNIGKIGIKSTRMPRTKCTSYQPQEAEEVSRRPSKEPMLKLEPPTSDVRDEDMLSVERSVEGSEEDEEKNVSTVRKGDEDSEEDEDKEEEGDEEETDQEIIEDINAGQQILQEERLDEGFNSEDDDAGNHFNFLGI